MKVYEGVDILFLTTALEAGGELHALLALPLCNDPWYPLNRKVVKPYEQKTYQ
jgi:hypothetical protein